MRLRKIPAMTRMSAVISCQFLVFSQGTKNRKSCNFVEDEMVVAVDVERRLALANNPDRQTVVPEGQEASPDTYELYFNDESGNNLAIL